MGRTCRTSDVRLVVAQGDSCAGGQRRDDQDLDLPKGTRSRCWFGPSDLHDYTIQADVRGAIKDDKLPDIGLIAQGYTLDLQGEHQRLQIRSWDPQLRMAQDDRFPLGAGSLVHDEVPCRPGKWASRVASQGLAPRTGGTGRVDPRGDRRSPQSLGQSGSVWQRHNAEIFLDNIRVTSN